MSPNKKYGAVYTPERLAVFVASLIKAEADKDNYNLHTVLDPACGECALLFAMQTISKDTCFFGVDVDEEAIHEIAGKEQINLICDDAILPSKLKGKTHLYWKKRLPAVSAIIANPPWSSEKIYDKQDLTSAGFTLTTGQYDSYVLFLELAYELIAPGGYFGFILPDSLFDNQNESLRRFLAQKTQIRVLARLGEKIFDEVNRATTVIVCRKQEPKEADETMCFRLNTAARKEFLTSDIPLEAFYKQDSHPVRQSRFLANTGCLFDVDARADEEVLLTKIKKDSVDWESTFLFGRGVEISKTGEITICPKCNHAQGYTKAQAENKKKTCTHCGVEIPFDETTLQNIISSTPIDESERIVVGENVKRYSLTGESYINVKIPGINYKNNDLYIPPKILIRKTGLGIYACVDYSGGMTSQTVYIVRYKTDEGSPPLEYYLALLNSRVVYYYYLKVYGENEWKSHPYFTKKIIYSLPLRKFSGTQLDLKIAELAKRLSKEYSYELDLELESLIMELYAVTAKEQKLIVDEMQQLPDLSAINGMKFNGRTQNSECTDI